MTVPALGAYPPFVVPHVLLAIWHNVENVVACAAVKGVAPSHSTAATSISR
jgi:hypothetical protein